jgi:uncharacterized membrane protein YccF (DUF307 family)
MPDQNVTVNVNLGMPSMQVRHQPGCLMQLLYFMFIGWWLGALAVVLAYLCFGFIITIPFGVMIINKIPYLMALREVPRVITPWGEVKAQQHNIILRAIVSQIKIRGVMTRPPRSRSNDP